jgi:hypothetical protein
MRKRFYKLYYLSKEFGCRTPGLSGLIDKELKIKVK